MPHPDHEKNRAAWNEMVGIHYDHPDYRTKEFLAGESKLMPIEHEALGNVRGKHLLHLMCQFGLDTLSWAREGAIVTGVDISDESIRRAEQLTREAKLSATFVRSDVLDLIGVIDRKFDIVFQSYGTHIWISDIAKWGQVVAHHLKPGGTFFMIDSHPARVLFLNPPLGYFPAPPERTIGAPDYCDRDYKIKHELVEWQHTMSDILNALIDAGLTIEHVGEYNTSFFPEEPDWPKGPDGYWTPPSGPPTYPLMMSVKATK